MEDNDVTIGVVSGVLGIRWFDCTVTGMEAHMRPHPMALRKDALLAATRIMQDVVAAAHRHPPHGRGTVGMVQVFPNSRNVIPGRVKFSIDLRNATDALVDQMADEVKAFAAKVGGGARRGREDRDGVQLQRHRLPRELRRRRGPRRQEAGLLNMSVVSSLKP